MAIFSAIAAGIGLLVEGIGAAAATVGSIGASTGALTAAGAAASIGGTAISYLGNRKAAEASQRAEQLRAKQMEEENARRQREIFRKQMVAQALSRQRATTQGVDFGSSVVPAAVGQAASSAALESQYADTNTQIGEGVFQANADRAEGLGQAAIGTGIKELGKDLITSAEPISRTIAQIGSNYGTSQGGSGGIGRA